jgi:hypothetical protein
MARRRIALYLTEVYLAYGNDESVGALRTCGSASCVIRGGRYDH